MSGRFGKYGETKRLDRFRRSGDRDTMSSGRHDRYPPERERRDAEVSLRNACARDYAAIASLAEKSFEVYGPYGSTIREWLGYDGIDTLAAVGDDELLGFIMTAPVHSITTTLMEIMAVSVTPRAQRSGVGTRLLLTAEKNAVRQGAVYMLLHTATTNTAAQSFFRKHGYKVVETKSRYYPKGQDALRMIKRLR